MFPPLPFHSVKLLVGKSALWVQVRQVMIELS